MRGFRTSGAAACTIVALGIAASSRAGTNAWTTTGPPGAKLISVAVAPTNPSVIYAGAISYADAANLYKSTDGGSTWTRLVSGMPPSQDFQGIRVAVAPGDADVVYASGYSRIFKSTDGGATWQSTFIPGSGAYYQITIDPADSSRIYLVTSGGIFLSTDAGVNWSNTIISPPAPTYQMALDPSNSNTMWVSGQGSVAVSTDGGVTWQTRATGLQQTDFIDSISVDPSDPNHLYIGIMGLGVWTTTDGGNQWTQSGLPTDSVETVFIDPSSPSTVYAGTLEHGAFVSVDSGATWQPLSALCSSTIYWISTAPGSPTRLMAAGTGGFFQSADSGATWSPTNDGLLATDAVVLLDPSNPHTVYAGTHGGGVFKSTDGGATWSTACGNIGNSNVLSLAISSLHPATLFAGTEAGVYKTTDGGSTWALLGLANYPVYAVAIDPTDDSRVYAGTRSYDFPGLFWASSDGGNTWSRADTGLQAFGETYQIAIDPSNPSTIYAAEYSWNYGAGDLYKTTDGGAHWLPTHLTNYGSFAVALDPSDPSIVYSSAETYIERSTDGGATWSVLANSYYAGPIVVDPAHPTDIYACQSGGVLVSRDAGQTWGFSWVGAGAETFTVSLALDNSVSPARIYTGLWDGGVYSIDPVAPEVDSVTPSSGSTNGGTAITITGKNFIPGSEVRMEGITFGANHVKVLDGQTITLDATPPGPGGAADVTVVSPTGILATGQFTYECLDPFTATVSGGGTICQNAGTTAQIAATLTGFGPWTLHWSDGVDQVSQYSYATRSVSPDSTTTYTLASVTDSSGCGPGTTSGSATVTVDPNPIPVISAPATVTAGATGLVATVPIQAGSWYSWWISGGMITSGNGTSRITFIAGSPGTLTLQAVAHTSLGCVSPPGTFEVNVEPGAAPETPVDVADDLYIDPSGSMSNGNGVLEPGETVMVDPSWVNATDASTFLTGTASAFAGPGPLWMSYIYQIPGATASYSTLGPGAISDCWSEGYCYGFTLGKPFTRPAAHWDARFTETLDDGTSKVWTLHVGNSFSDVPTSYLLYPQVESLFHNQVTLGFGDGTFRPDDSMTRAQMVMFIARAELGSDANVPESGAGYDCTVVGSATNFPDVKGGDQWCPHANWAYVNNVADTCDASGDFCPLDIASRVSMGEEVSRAIPGIIPAGDPAIPPAYEDPVKWRGYNCDPARPNIPFSDVAASDPFCKNVCYLWARGIIDGFANGTYGVGTNVTRAQMAKYLVNAFGLKLNGP